MLTKRKIMTLKVPDGKRSVSISAGGLTALKFKSGVVSFTMKYTCPVTKKVVKDTIGYWPELSIEDAYIEMNDKKRIIRTGRSPRLNVEVITFSLEDAIAKYYDTHLYNVPTAKDTMSRLLRFTPGKVITMDIKEIRPFHIMKALSNLNHIPTTQKLYANEIKRVFNFCVAVGILEISYFTDITKTLKPIKRDPPKFAQYKDIHRLIALVTKNLGPVGNAAMFQWLTAMRPGEAGKLKTSYINWNNGYIMFPASEMKSRRDHIIPITKQIGDLLKSICPVDGYYFPARRRATKAIGGIPHAHISILYQSVLNGTELQGITPHRTRATFTTICRNNGFSRDEVEAALAHEISLGVEKFYLRHDIDYTLKRTLPVFEWWNKVVVGEIEL